MKTNYPTTSATLHAGALHVAAISHDENGTSMHHIFSIPDLQETLDEYPQFDSHYTIPNGPTVISLSDWWNDNGNKQRRELIDTHKEKMLQRVKDRAVIASHALHNRVADEMKEICSAYNGMTVDEIYHVDSSRRFIQRQLNNL